MARTTAMTRELTDEVGALEPGRVFESVRLLRLMT